MRAMVTNVVVCGVGGALAAATVAGCRTLPSAGANGLLHPARRVLTAQQRVLGPLVTFHSGRLALAGWRFPAAGTRRGTIVYLHGVADNRGAASGIAARFTARGFEVVAYDSRAHGDSDGDACTYGYYEKGDLRRVLDTLEPGPVVLIGSSLGAAVALQAAAEDARISAVVAAEAFSDLATVARERAPWFFSAGSIRRAFELAEQMGTFTMADVSPVRAAPAISIPVFLLHGSRDRETPSEHSRRIFDALAGPRRLLMVAGAGHNQSLAMAWPQIEQWIDEAMSHQQHFKKARTSAASEPPTSAALNAAAATVGRRERHGLKRILRLPAVALAKAGGRARLRSSSFGEVSP